MALNPSGPSPSWDDKLGTAKQSTIGDSHKHLVGHKNLAGGSGREDIIFADADSEGSWFLSTHEAQTHGQAGAQRCDRSGAS